MSVLDRILDVTKAAAHEVLSKLEDPVMMLNHYLRDMEEEIAGLEKELAKQTAAERGLKIRIDDLLRLAGQNEAKAEAALSGGQESEARLALEAKLHVVGQARACTELYETAKLTVIELTRQLEQAKTEHANMQEKRAELAQRAQKAAAKVRTTVHDFGSGFEGGSASRGFRRMEDKILEWEARAELAGKRYSKPGAYEEAAGHAPAGAQAQTERDAWVEEQLERLRQKRQPEQE